jgi:hypothetical protein
MNGGNSDNTKWKFDPNTGEPIEDGTPEAQAPSERASAPSGEIYNAPITGPLGQTPATVDDTNVDAFRAPFQAQEATPPQRQSEQAAYQQATPATPAVPAQPATEPYGYQQAQTTVVGQPVAAQTVAVKPKSSMPLIAGIIGVLVVAALLVGGYFVYQNVLNRPSVSVEKLLPGSTLGYFSFDPVLEGSQKAAMDKIGEAFQSQPGFKDAWDKITSESTGMLGEAGCQGTTATTPTAGFDAISAYLGNSITLAVLAPSSADLQKLKDSTGNGDMESVGMDVVGKNVVGLVDLDFNPLNKQGPIADLKKQVDNIANAPSVEKYRDVDIRKFTPQTCGNSGSSDASMPVYYALLDNSSTAIVAAQVDPLHTIIDGYRDNKSLKDNDTFKSLSGQVPQDRIAALYLNLTDIYKQVQLAVPELTQDQTVQNVNGAMLITLSAANDGLQIDSASETDASLMGAQVQVNPNARPEDATISDVPSNALAFVVGTDLQTVLKASLDAVRKQDTSGDIDEQIKSFEQQFNLSLDNDVLPLLSGDYALSVSPGPSGDRMAPAVLFQLKVKDSQKAADVLSKIMTASGSGTDTVQISGGQFYYVEPSSGLITGVAKDRLWFLFDADSQNAQAHLTDAIGNLGKGFGSGSQWASVKSHLAKDSNVVVYANITGVREAVETSFLQDESAKKDYEQSAAPFVKPLKYLLVGSATQDAKNGTLSRNHTILFIGISK